MSPKAESPPLSGSVPALQHTTQEQFGGVIAILVGVSQQLVGIIAIDGLTTFVVAGGGALLFLFGYNLVQNRSAFHNGWSKDGEHGLLGLLTLALVTAYVVVAAGIVLVS